MLDEQMLLAEFLQVKVEQLGNIAQRVVVLAERFQPLHAPGLARKPVCHQPLC